MEELFASVANLGFPIAVATYLLIRFEGKLTELTNALWELRKTMEECMKERDQ